jgi:hypothetical protein
MIGIEGGGAVPADSLARSVARRAAALPAGLDAAVVLAGLGLVADPAELADRLGEDGLFDVLAALSKLERHLGGLRYRMLSALDGLPFPAPRDDADGPLARDAAAWADLVRANRTSTVAALCGFSPYVAGLALGRAAELAPRGRMARVGAALEGGHLSVAAAERIADELTGIEDDGLAADIAAAVLPVAPTLGLGRLREALRAEVAVARPAEAVDQLRSAAQARTATRPVDEGAGLASMQLLGPAPAVLHVYRSAQGLAKAELTRQESARAAGLMDACEVDSIGALRFDAVLALIDGAASREPAVAPLVFAVAPRVGASAVDSPAVDGPALGTDRDRAEAAAGFDAESAEASLAESAAAAALSADRGWQPEIRVIVPLSTLLGADDLPAELDGFGPLDPATARKLAADPTGTWTRLLVDDRGRVLERSSAYRPPRSMAALLKARDRTCRFPGCGRTRMDLDHIIERSAGGPTERANLAGLCRTHHNLKTYRFWDYRLDAATGDALWTDRHGNTATQPPTRYRQGTRLPAQLLGELMTAPRRAPRRHRRIAIALQRIQHRGARPARGGRREAAEAAGVSGTTGATVDDSASFTESSAPPSF